MPVADCSGRSRRLVLDSSPCRMTGGMVSGCRGVGVGEWV